MSTLLSTWQKLGHPRVLVVGDLLLDQYVWGTAERISPEAPVLVLREEDRLDHRPGGAANVASLLRGLDAEVSIVGVIGADADGEKLRELLDEKGIDTTGIVVDPARPTSRKQRFVGRTGTRQPHQLLRVDRENCTPIEGVTEHLVRQHLQRQVHCHDVVLISDYSKGVANSMVLRETIALAREAERPILVDPGRTADYSDYAGATLVAPNRQAAEVQSRCNLRDESTILRTASTIRVELNLQTAVITLDREGMAYSTEKENRLVPCHQRQVCDVTGAGDMVLAMLGLCTASRVPLREAVELANVAAGLEVERFGAEPIFRDEISNEIEGTYSSNLKVQSLDGLLRHISRHRRDGRSIVFTNGCFDLLHVGHIQMLQQASTLGDILIVAINSDSSVRALKGLERPVIGEHDRALTLSALNCVDHVLLFSETTPHHLLQAIRPDVLVKGGTSPQVIGREIVEHYGGTVVRLAAVPLRSTTRIVSQIRQEHETSTARGTTA